MDAIDRRILEVLQRDGRVSNVALAKQVGLSAPAVLRRVERLEQEGVINRYVALLDRRKIGKELVAFIQISIDANWREKSFAEKIEEYPNILECYHITGQTDYLLKVVASHIDELEDFISNSMTRMPGVDKVVTSIVLSEVKTETAMPIDEPPDL